MCWGKLKKYYQKIKAFFLPEYSKEYQRMLAGIKVYFSMMKQRYFMNATILLILMFFFLLTVIVGSNILRGIEPTLSTIYNGVYFVSFFIVLMLLMFLFSILWQHDFKVIKGIKILIKNPMAFLITISFVGIGIISFFSSHSSLLYKITSILTMLIILFSYLLLFSVLFLKPQSLLNYASEKLEKTDKKIKSKRFDKGGYYVQYYYSILTYYKQITRKYRITYQDDVLVRTKSQLLPLLCSQGLISKPQSKKLLIKDLKELSEIDPFNYPYKFTDKMTVLENNLLKDVIDDTKNKVYNILRDKTGKEKIREYLFYIITILSVVSAIINTFFREVILSIIRGMF
jgi:hypothetical protein